MHALVLVVEDEPSLNRAMCTLLENLGEQVLSFATAEDAWAHAPRWLGKCGCAFIDVTLPGASGLDLAHRLRDRFPDLPIILTSGLQGVWCLEALEPVCYMTKPFGLEEIEEALAWRTACALPDDPSATFPLARGA
jgi:FixJ family two-component response regulator